MNMLCRVIETMCSAVISFAFFFSVQPHSLYNRCFLQVSLSMFSRKDFSNFRLRVLRYLWALSTESHESMDSCFNISSSGSGSMLKNVSKILHGQNKSFEDAISQFSLMRYVVFSKVK